MNTEWIMLICAFAGVVLAGVCLLLSKSFNKDANFMADLGKIMLAGDKVGTMKTCLRGLDGNYGNKTKRKIAEIYCQTAAGFGDVRYEHALGWLEFDYQRQYCQALYALTSGDCRTAEELCKKVIQAPKKRKYNNLTFKGYRLLGEVYLFECKYEAEYAAYMAGARIKGNVCKYAQTSRMDLAVSALQRAVSMFNVVAAEEAFAVLDKKTAAAMQLTMDEFKGVVARARKEGVDVVDYAAKLFAALDGERVVGFNLKDAGDIKNPDTYFGGAIEYDTPALKTSRARFLAQIVYADIPDGEYRKPYTLRFWIADDLLGKGEGVYECRVTGGDTENSDGNIYACIYKGKKQRFNFASGTDIEKRRFAEMNFGFIPMRFLKQTNYPDDFSDAVKDACDKVGLPLPSVVLGKLSPLRNELRGGRVFGNTYILRATEAIREYNVCLYQQRLDNEIYSYLMKKDDFIKDDFSDVIILKQIINQ